MPTVTGIATSFIDFTRASNATVTDSDGFVKWAPHNLLLASESFDAASWTKSSVTPTANSIAAPNGTTTADTLAASGANGTTLQTFTAEAISYTFGVWLKRKTGTGNIQIAADSGTYTTVTITSDWALYTVTQTPAAGSKSAGIRIVTSADEVYAWGAHLYRSDLGGMQPNTSAYPMYNPTTPKNLLGYTEDFSAAAWQKLVNGTGVLPVVTKNYGLAPNGLQVANRVQFDLGATPSTAFSRLFQGISTTLTKAVNSIYLKTNDGSTKTLYIINSAGSTVSLITVTGEWQRFDVAASASSATGQLQFGLSGISSGVTATTSTTADILAWGAQLSDSASLDSYVPVYGAAVTSAAYYGPRRDFDSAGVCRGLLVEEQRTNYLLYSNVFSNVAWTRGGVAPTVDYGFTAPDGSSTAWRVTFPNGSAGSQFYQSLSASLGFEVTQSLWIKADSSLALTYGFYDSTGDTTNITATSTWQKFTKTRAAGLITGDRRAQWLYLTGASAPQSIYIWNAQLEQGSFATSYIPTGASSATRNADVASVSTQAFPYSATEGTIVVNFIRPTSVLNAHAISFTATNSNMGPGMIIDNVSGGVRAIYYDGTTASPDGSATSVGAVGTVVKAAIGYKSADTARSINGGTVATSSASLSTVSFTTMRIGDSPAMQNPINGHIRQITYIPRRLANAELQTRTS